MTLTNMKNNRMGSIKDKKKWKEMPESLGWERFKSYIHDMGIRERIERKQYESAINGWSWVTIHMAYTTYINGVLK